MRGDDPELMESWGGYSVGKEYSIARADEKIISVVLDCYEFTGGAHPNSGRVAYTFDAQTGEKLSLEAVVKDLDEAQSVTTEFLTEKLAEQEQEEGMLFDDYQSYIQDILTDNTFPPPHSTFVTAKVCRMDLKMRENIPTPVHEIAPSFSATPSGSIRSKLPPGCTAYRLLPDPGESEAAKRNKQGTPNRKSIEIQGKIEK